MRGNSQVRFLGGFPAVRRGGYPACDLESRVFNLCQTRMDSGVEAVRVSPRKPTGACIAGNCFVRSRRDKRKPC